MQSAECGACVRRRQFRRQVLPGSVLTFETLLFGRRTGGVRHGGRPLARWPFWTAPASRTRRRFEWDVELSKGNDLDNSRLGWQLLPVSEQAGKTARPAEVLRL